MECEKQMLKPKTKRVRKSKQTKSKSIRSDDPSDESASDDEDKMINGAAQREETIKPSTFQKFDCINGNCWDKENVLYRVKFKSDNRTRETKDKELYAEKDLVSWGYQIAIDKFKASKDYETLENHEQHERKKEAAKLKKRARTEPEQAVKMAQAEPEQAAKMAQEEPEQSAFAVQRAQNMASNKEMLIKSGFAEPEVVQLKEVRMKLPKKRVKPSRCSSRIQGLSHVKYQDSESENNGRNNESEYQDSE